jgi:hypothetical protein
MYEDNDFEIHFDKQIFLTYLLQLEDDNLFKIHLM